MKLTLEFDDPKAAPTLTAPLSGPQASADGALDAGASAAQAPAQGESQTFGPQHPQAGAAGDSRPRGDAFGPAALAPDGGMDAGRGRG